MNNDINEKIVHAAPVPPFVRFVASAVPMVFDNSLSYYECLCALWKWMQDNLVDVINNNATVTEHYIDLDLETRSLFNQLKTYVDTYFDNLDVQEEINNKLDEMVEAGTLQEIITSYIQSNVAWTFDTVADMKQSTNLVDGSYAQTLGFYSINDGGSALYKISNTGSANELDTIAIGNLYAHLVLGNNMSVKQFGAYADNTHDDSAAINLSLSKLNYAYLPNGTYLTNNTITVSAYQKLSGESKLNAIIHYTGNGNCITETDSTDTVKFEISNLTLQGNNNEGCGLYLWRTNRVMPTPGDCYAHVYNICAQGFDTGIFIGKYQNVSKYENIEGNYCNIGIKFDHADDIFADKLLAHGNANHGIWFLSSSNLNMSNLYAYYNGRADDTQYYNFIFGSCSGINISGLTAQESYGDNIRMSYTNNVIIANAYLSWPGLTKVTPNQINLIGCNNCSIKATSQNGQYGVSGYNNYVLGLRDDTKNCDVQISVEADFPSSQKINNIGSTQSYNVYNGNIFVISKQGDLKINKVNYLKNGTLLNKTDLTAVGNSSFCSWVNGKLRVDMTGQTYARTVNWKIAELPRSDVYTTYIHFKKVSGTGIVSFNAPGAVSVNAADNEYWISFTKYMESTTEDQTIPLQVAKELVIDVLEAGICLGESGAFELPLASGAIV